MAESISLLTGKRQSAFFSASWSDERLAALCVSSEFGGLQNLAFGEAKIGPEDADADADAGGTEAGKAALEWLLTVPTSILLHCAAYVSKQSCNESEQSFRPATVRPSAERSVILLQVTCNNR